jgi:hypothetical protein
MSRFGHLDKRNVSKAAEAVSTFQSSEPASSSSLEPSEAPAARAPAARAKAREGKKPVIGYFSEDLSRELRMLSAIEGRTMQALLGEAIDLLMTDRGRNRFNER